MITKYCDICHVEYVAHMEIQKYCPACAEEGYRRRNAENWKREHATSIYRICRTCHVEFERKPRTNQLHCQPCIDAKAERKANPPKMYCSVCHKEFKHKNPRVKRCSVECEKIRKKQYAQAQKAADSARRNAHRKAMRMAEPPPVVVVSGGMHPCYFGGDRCHSVVCQLIYASGGIA